MSMRMPAPRTLWRNDQILVVAGGAFLTYLVVVLVAFEMMNQRQRAVGLETFIVTDACRTYEDQPNDTADHLVDAKIVATRADGLIRLRVHCT